MVETANAEYDVDGACAAVNTPLTPEEGTEEALIEALAHDADVATLDDKAFVAQLAVIGYVEAVTNVVPPFIAFVAQLAVI